MRYLKTILILLSSIFICSCAPDISYHNNDNTVIVSIEESNYYTVKSKNPKQAKRGESLDFRIDFNDNYGFKSSSNGYFEKGFLRVEDVQYSETIRINCAEFLIVSVATPDNCHFKIVSSNPLFVEKGQSAVFDVQFEEGYTFESSSAGYYKNGKLIIDGLENNFEVILTAKPIGNIHIQVAYDESIGVIKINGNLTDNYYCNSGESITVESIPLEGNKFVCWSYDDYISHSMPFSFERVLHFEPKEDTNICANIWNNNSDTIIYSANGGSTQCGDELIYYPHTKGNHIRLNTIQGSNAFIKDGYLLDSWNTKQDGSGIRIGLGSRIKATTDGKPQILYANWIPETDPNLFEFELIDNSSYALKKCFSNESIIVIPKSYNGIPVTLIKSNSLVSLNFRTLYLSTSIKQVESHAIENCYSFKEFHFFDSLISIPNDFSSIMPSRLYINANTDPCYVGSYQNAFVKKTDLLLECNNEKIVFIGNSNTMYSIDGSMIKKAFNKDVLCYGVQDGVGVAWELACLKYYCSNENNTIVFCSEFGADRIGSFSEHKFYSAENNYDLLLAIDFNELKYNNVYGAYSKFIEMKQHATVTPYSNNDYNCDEYGCLKMEVEPYRSDDWCSSIVNVNVDFYKNGGFDWVEAYLSDLKNSKIAISSCSFNKNCIEISQREYFYSEYQQSIIDSIHFPIISKLEDYAFTGAAFTTDNYHLIYSYAVERTNKLISDMKFSLPL